MTNPLQEVHNRLKAELEQIDKSPLQRRASTKSALVTAPNVSPSDPVVKKQLSNLSAVKAISVRKWKNVPLPVCETVQLLQTLSQQEYDMLTQQAKCIVQLGEVV
jgi:hypothetical protein